ncbi:CAP domain-containing protein [Streptomyces cinerochromogenes]|uniref:CAP domain-containing protein n=1 Tax=Streptomyces cinerochromogenes TaxID=66422 RepID=UPI0036795A46
MGRHRRSAAGRAATGRATGVTHTQRSGSGSGSGTEDAWHSSRGERRIPMGTAPYLNPEAYAEATAKAQAYLFATDGAGSASSSGSGASAPAGGPSRDRRRRGRAGRPVRAGLLGMSAAVALGTVAVTTGVVPGLDHYRLGGSTHTAGGDRVQSAGAPSNTASEQGGTSGSVDSPAATPPGPGGTAGRADSPNPSDSPSASRSPSASASKSASPTRTPTRTPSKTPARKPAPKTTPRATPSKPSASPRPKGTPSRTATRAPASASTPVTVSREAAVEAEVLKLVNEERTKAGVSPLAANSSLTKLAESFSDDMAARGFFDHTDPDGRSPWDRAAAAGVTDLGGENIARGQADAAAVVQAWMSSPGHRANILNPDFKTLGVGVHFAPGGPWWTQDFGY